MSFSLTYFPKPEELAPEFRQAYRQRLAEIIRTLHADINSAPGSVVGDHVVAPLADCTLLMDLAMERFFSDLRLETVANGTVYNCDVVREYLKNFGVRDVQVNPARGFVRMVFSSAQTRWLPRNLEFSFGGDRIFTPYLAGDQPACTLQAAGLAVTQLDTYVYVKTVSGFEVILPLQGVASSPVLEGSQASLSTQIPDLQLVSAASAFTSGGQVATLPELARLAQQTFATNSQTGAGLSAAVRRQFSDMVVVQVVRSQDAEAVRPPPLSTVSEAENVDVLVRGTTATIARQLSVFGVFDTTSETYQIHMPGMHCVRILGVRHQASGRVFEKVDSGAGYRVLSTFDAFDPTSLFPMTPAEQLTVQVNPGTELLAAEVVPPDIGATFIVDVEEDPSASMVGKYFANPDNQPFGLSRLQIRPLVPTFLSEVRLTYRKYAAVGVTTQNLTRDLRVLLESFGGSDSWSLAELVERCRFNGISNLLSISFSGMLHWSAAQRFFAGARPANGVAFNSAWAAADPYPIPSISAEQDPRRTLNLTCGALNLNVTPRSQGYITRTTNFVFDEVP